MQNFARLDTNFSNQENLESIGSASTEELIVLNHIVGNSNATEIAIAIRIPRGNSIFEESLESESQQGSFSTTNANENFEELLAKNFSQEQEEEQKSFFEESLSNSWKVQPFNPTDDVNFSSLLSTYSLNQL